MRLANRTGKVIALGRTTLSVFILGAVFSNIDGVVEFPRVTLVIGVAYVALSLLLMALTWSNWWLEHRLRLPSHLVDMAFFVALDLATGVAVTSPFFIFFVFLVLSAAAKWGWRAGMLTGAAATLLFAGETAVEIFSASISREEYLFSIVRGGHLIVLSLMISWFGVTHLSSRFALTKSFPKSLSGGPPAQHSAEYLADCLHAGWVVIIWSEPEEPWLNLGFWSSETGFRLDRAGPADYPWLVAPEVEGRTFLFDLGRKRCLFPDKRHLRTRDHLEAIDASFAARIGVTAGIATPLESDHFQGYLFAAKIGGMCWDDLPIMRKAGRDISQAFDRWEAMRVAAEASEGETRLRVARDLHDSVAQIMAGVALKLRAARTNAADAEQRDRELRGIEADLVEYQQQIRGMIETLRHPESGGVRLDLDAKLEEVAASLRRQWNVEVEFTGDHLASVPRMFCLEIEHLIREAGSNGVRHGGATRLFISAEIRDGALRIRAEDNGSGFPQSGRFDDDALSAEAIGPRSIIDRVHGLGGSVELVSRQNGAIVSISLPLESSLPLGSLR